MNIAQMTDDELDRLQYAAPGTGPRRSRNFARAVLAIRDAQWNALIAGQAGEAVAWDAFDAAYKKACETSDPHEYFGAALLAQQVRASLPAPQAAQAEQVEALSDELKRLLNTFERQAQRFGELWGRFQGKGWPEKESEEFHSLRDDRMPKTRAALLKALATQPTAINVGEQS